MAVDAPSKLTCLMLEFLQMKAIESLSDDAMASQSVLTGFCDMQAFQRALNCTVHSARLVYFREWARLSLLHPSK